MFFKRNKEKTLHLFDEYGREILCCEVRDLPLKEDVVIAKSIEFFCDAEPCYIHRGAVMTRLYAEIEASACKASTGNVTAIDFESDTFKPFLYIDCDGFISFSIN